MRKLILGLAVSLDGFIEGPRGEYDWCFTDQDYGMNEFMKRVDALFIGRKTYELMQSMEQSGEPGFPQLRHYVFSTTLERVKKGDVLIGDHTIEQVKKIKSSPGKDIWLFGGANLTASLMNHELVDELWLSVHPVILGGGKPLFSGIRQRLNLELMESKTYSTGLVSLRYILRNDSR